MISLRLAVLVVIATSAAAFVNPSAFGTRACTSLSASLLDTAASLQGPGIVWGSDGAEFGHGENDIKGYDNLTKFVAAVQAAGLSSVLQGPGPYTVFAPTDSAVDQYATKGGQLTADVLKYHIVEGRHTADSISGDLKTLQGESLTYKRQFRQTFVDDAIVGQADNFGGGSVFPKDVQADNGLIHAISLVCEPGYQG
mmetsp:Transcript_2187/g.3239  ORF Transcript_2187/g.3239 Transcript_2187/m.3239 type:complete len:197 (-) Transcript_2187:179-769(-)|eukprot:CAMPEP_0113939052 /NCGR_PEP_ID=MMETSP1339-20121228/5419_1 /TAXON_ID=94617 /ORGANISM="Fibrocapsa japonica" /LENGTH=196 /DNA_ID=CAMNT_0000942439 /DNA_START=133 /DNA_END=723 /DNA_ORIENTATION=- /assembly_acc=CAM_ASM_000762